MLGVECLRRVFGRAVAVVETDVERILSCAADERRVEFQDGGVECAIAVALVEVAVDVAEFPPEVLQVLVSDSADFRMHAAPSAVVEVNDFATERFVATPRIYGIGGGDYAYGQLAYDTNLSRVPERDLRARLFGGDDAVHVLAAFGEGAFAEVVEAGTVLVVVVLGYLFFERLVGFLVETFPGEPTDALPYVVHAGVEFEGLSCGDIDLVVLYRDDGCLCRERDVHGVHRDIAVIVGDARNAVEYGGCGGRLPYGVELRYGLPVLADVIRCGATPFALFDVAREVGVVVVGRVQYDVVAFAHDCRLGGDYHGRRCLDDVDEGRVAGGVAVVVGDADDAAVIVLCGRGHYG